MTDTTFDPRRPQRLVILQHSGLLTPKHGKTGISLLRYRGDEVVAFDIMWFGNDLTPHPKLTVVRGADEPLQRLKDHAQRSAHRVLVLAESDGRRESLLDFLRASHLNPPAFDSLDEFLQSEERLGIATAALQNGFAWTEQGIDFVTETELFAAGVTTRRRKKQEQVSDVEALIKDLSELKLGDPVVHNAHGIGRYRGLINMDLGEKNPDGTPALQEFLHLFFQHSLNFPKLKSQPLHSSQTHRD